MTEAAKNKLRILEPRDIGFSPSFAQEARCLLNYAECLRLSSETRVPEACCSRSLNEDEEVRQEAASHRLTPWYLGVPLGLSENAAFALDRLPTWPSRTQRLGGRSESRIVHAGPVVS